MKSTVNLGISQHTLAAVPVCTVPTFQVQIVLSSVKYRDWWAISYAFLLFTLCPHPHPPVFKVLTVESYF